MPENCRESVQSVKQRLRSYKTAADKRTAEPFQREAIFNSSTCGIDTINELDDYHCSINSVNTFVGDSREDRLDKTRKWATFFS